MPNETTTILLTLLAATPGAREAILSQSRDFWDVPPAEGELSQLYDDALTLLDRLIEEVSEDWGVPMFIGSYGDEGYPPWSEAIKMAYWTYDEKFAFLAVRHADHEFPVSVEAGALTRAEADALGE